MQAQASLTPFLFARGTIVFQPVGPSSPLQKEHYIDEHLFHSLSEYTYIQEFASSKFPKSPQHHTTHHMGTPRRYRHEGFTVSFVYLSNRGCAFGEYGIISLSHITGPQESIRCVACLSHQVSHRTVHKHHNLQRSCIDLPDKPCSGISRRQGPFLDRGHWRTPYM